MKEDAIGSTPRRTWWWSAAFVGLVSAWLSAFVLHPEWLTAVGVGHYRVEVRPNEYQELWFIDSFAILASNDAAAAGKDPYAPNEFDLFKRPHVYGPDWLYLRHLGLSRHDVIGVGLVLVGLFIAAAVFVLRPASAGEVLWCAAFFCSAPVLAAVERANNDLLVFLLLTLVVPCLLSQWAPSRWLAVPLIALAAALKYYPVVAAPVLMGPGTTAERRCRMIGLVGALAIVAWHILALRPHFVHIPAPTGLLTMGAVVPFRELGLEGRVPQVTMIGVGALLFLLGWNVSTLRDWEVPAQWTRDWLYFVLGAFILTGCFFVGQHYAYRWTFGLWLVPFLWRSATSDFVPPAIRRLAVTTSALLLAVLWAESIFVLFTRSWPHDEMMRAAQLMHWAMQPIFWAFILCLMTYLAKFVRESRLGVSRAEPAVASP